MMLYRKPVASILPPLSYRSADHGGDRHPDNSTGALIFRNGGEWWLDLCRVHESGQLDAHLDGDTYDSRASVFPDGSVFEFKEKTWEVMGHDRPGARLWVRRINETLDVPTTEEREPEIREATG